MGYRGDMGARCDVLAPLRELKKHRASPESRAYMLVGAMTAREVLRRRKSFSTHDLKLRRIPTFLPTMRPDMMQRRYAAEFLSSWERQSTGMSLGAKRFLESCPSLGKRVQKLWKGY